MDGLSTSLLVLLILGVVAVAAVAYTPTTFLGQWRKLADRYQTENSPKSVTFPDEHIMFGKLLPLLPWRSDLGEYAKFDVELDDDGLWLLYDGPLPPKCPAAHVHTRESHQVPERQAGAVFLSHPRGPPGAYDDEARIGRGHQAKDDRPAEPDILRLDLRAWGGTERSNKRPDVGGIVSARGRRGHVVQPVFLKSRQESIPVRRSGSEGRRLQGDVQAGTLDRGSQRHGGKRSQTHRDRCRQLGHGKIHSRGAVAKKGLEPLAERVLRPGVGKLKNRAKNANSGGH